MSLCLVYVQIYVFLIYCLYSSITTRYIYCTSLQDLAVSVNVQNLLFPASGAFCRLLITFVNSLDPDQAWQNVRSDLDPNCLTLWWYSKLFIKKIHRWQKSMHNYPACKKLNTVEPQWLEHLWDHGNSFETWVVRATEGKSWHQFRKQIAII